MKQEPQRVLWSEGMLMSPHHLQQQDLYHEHLLFARTEAFSPHGFGVVSLEVDPGALARGEVRLASFAGVLPDGMPIGFELGDDDAPAARSIGAHYPAGQGNALEVYLAMPREREGTPSFGDGAAGLAARFTAVSRKVPDLGDDANLAEVTFGRRNLALLFGDERRDDFSALKIAEVTRDGTGALVLAPTFVPPCLRISASTFLMEGLRRVLGLLLGKQRDLGERRRQRDASTLEFDAPDVTLFLQLHALNGLIPIIKHLAGSGDVAPYALYLVLAQAAGGLATFSTAVEPASLPSFRFDDLRATFEPLFAVITQLVQQTVKEAHLKVPLQIKNGVHFGTLEGEALQRCRQFVLSVRAADIPEEQVADRLPSRSKIASWNELETVIRGAKPGVPLRVTHRPPAQIPVRAGVVYFVLDTANPYWQQISRERRVGIYLPPPFDPAAANVELLAIPEAAS
jgi:type VI secretion system protein ImpJ